MVEHGRDFRLMLGPTAFQISVSPAGEAAFKDRSGERHSHFWPRFIF